MKLCIKCKRITRYGSSPICGKHNKTPPSNDFANKCKSYDPYELLIDNTADELKVLLKDGGRNETKT